MRVMLSERNDDWITPWRAGSADPLERLWLAQWNNVKVALELRWPWRKVRMVTNHQAQSMTRSALEHAAQQFHREWERTCASKFRGPDDLEFLATARYLALGNHTAVRGYLPNRLFRNEAELAELDAAALPTLFCINDGADTGGPEARPLQRLFPTPSAFERS
jgi:hypothetical protein